MKLSALTNSIELFRSLNPEMQAQMMLTFLLIASKDPRPVAMSDIGERLAIAQSSVTRNVQALSGTNRHGTRGYGLVHTWVNPENRRQKMVELTPHGRRIVELLKSIGE